jgi:hypothetical protein
MRNLKFIILIILLAFTLPYTYGGCVLVFSSGDTEIDKDQVDDENSGGFIGNSSQAAITSTNAESLAGGAFAGGLSVVEPKGVTTSQRFNADQTDVFRPLRFPLVLGDGLRRIELDTALNSSGQLNVITEIDNLAGSCGGELSYTLTLNRTTAKFSGNLIFADYCDAGIEISGQTDVDGTFETSSGAFDTASFSFDDLSDDTHTLDGKISMDFTDKPIVATFSAYSTDKHSGQVYWLKNYSINLFELFDRVEIEIFGTFYHPDNGFVTLTTPEPFVILESDDWPVAGQLLIKGDSDTKARLIAIDQVLYRIDADTDGDGIFDWNSEILYWTDL